jgi:hypothetical protein
MTTQEIRDLDRKYLWAYGVSDDYEALSPGERRERSASLIESVRPRVSDADKNAARAHERQLCERWANNGDAVMFMSGVAYGLLLALLVMVIVRTAA